MRLSVCAALVAISVACLPSHAHRGTWESNTEATAPRVHTRTQFHNREQHPQLDEGAGEPRRGYQSTHNLETQRCFDSCSARPTDACDFIFETHKSTLPTFNLTQVLFSRADVDSQIQLAEAMLKSGPGIVHYTGHWDSPLGQVKTKVKVESANFNKFLNCVKRETKALLHSDLLEAKAAAGEILARGEGVPDTWLLRDEATSARGPLSEGRRKVLRRFSQQCVKLPLEKMQLSVHVSVLGETRRSSLINLEIGDGHQEEAPDARRCVMFRTRV